MARMISLLKDDKGQGMVEYGLIIALVAIAVIGVVTLLGGNLKDIFTKINKALEFSKDIDTGHDR